MSYTHPEGVASGIIDGIGITVVGLIGAGLGTISGAMSGSTGAAIMQAANHTGYDVTESAQMGAVGGALLGVASGMLIGGGCTSRLSCGLFGRSTKTVSTSVSSVGLTAYAMNGVLSGLIGYGVLNSAERATAMQLGETAIAFAVGGLVSAIPFGVSVCCIGVPLAICYIAMTGDKCEEAEEFVFNSIPTYETFSY